MTGGFRAEWGAKVYAAAASVIQPGACIDLPLLPRYAQHSQGTGHAPWLSPTGGEQLPICIQPDRLGEVLAMSVTQDDEPVSLSENVPHPTLDDRRKRTQERLQHAYV